MNTDYKAASERTDADERTLTPAFKRRAFIEKHGVTGGTIESRTPAPNKAQHSPKRKLNTVIASLEQCSAIQSAKQLREVAAECATELKLIVRAVNHADKLAQALKHTLNYGGLPLRSPARKLISEVLAAYESEGN